MHQGRHPEGAPSRCLNSSVRVVLRYSLLVSRRRRVSGRNDVGSTLRLSQ